MLKPIEPAQLLMNDAGVSSAVFGDVYFNDTGGLEEKRHVFLEQNALRHRWARPAASFVIAETGFGTGLNFLSTLKLWQECCTADGWLHYVSVEKHPLRQQDLGAVLARWPELSTQAAVLLAQYPPLVPGFHRLLFPESQTTLTLLFGDAATMLLRLEAQVDAWFLDGFSPALNPEMWSPALFGEMARLSKPEATFSTFTAASSVHRDLESAGFFVEKIHGFGPKRDMLRGHLLPRQKQPDTKPWLHREFVSRERRIAVIGAGIAGCSLANTLALRGWQVDVFEKTDVASGASGNPAAIIYPKLSPPAIADEHFQQQAFLHAQRRFQALASLGVWNPCGVLWFLAGNQQREGEKLKGHPWPDELVHILDAEGASEQAGIEIPCPALHFPTAGWLDPRAFCLSLLNHPNIRVHAATNIVRVERTPQGWTLHTDSGKTYGSPTVVLANAGAAKSLPAAAELPLNSVRGQISQMRESALSSALKSVLCYGGYISPALNGMHCLGASFYPGQVETEVRSAEQKENRAGLRQYLPTLADSLEPTEKWLGRASLRCQSPDYLPLVGPLSDYVQFCEQFAPLRHGNTKGLAKAELLPGLYCSLGYGSKGFTTALLAAEVLAAELNGEPYPVSRQMLEALHPHRLWVKQLKRSRS